MYLFFRRISRLSARMDISRRFLSSIPPNGGGIWLPSTYVERFRSHQSLWVSDLTSAYWCEKQLEFQLLSGRDRHNQLEKEVTNLIYLNFCKSLCRFINHFLMLFSLSKKQQNICHYSQMSMSQRPSANDQWIEKLTIALQKLTVFRDYKCTRELMIITSIEGHWVIGKIDELRCDRSGQLTLIGTRTRNRMPREEQKKRDHFQVMLYKHMLDSLVSRKKFPVLYFFTHFSLNRYTLLSENVVQRIQALNMEAVTLEDLVLHI
ncbi:Exonuclease V [Cardamine amara subsp. amara]|uniref:Exonuclease V n=1 Tax=Cardamine amara subsp. amara TaxID=228776 RepID=A0ABD0ZI58_CARAN